VKYPKPVTLHKHAANAVEIFVREMLSQASPKDRPLLAELISKAAQELARKGKARKRAA
jgi:hypothetical protein